MQRIRFPVVVGLFLSLGCAGQKADTATATPAAATVTTAAPSAAQNPPSADPIPKGFFALTPQLVVPDVDAAIAFYEQAFGAKKLFSMPGPDGKTAHGEIKIGDSIVMIEPEHPKMKSPKSQGGTPVSLMMYVPDAKVAWDTAIAAGAVQQLPLQDQFWGDRFGQVVDPFGHQWGIATHIEDLTDAQIAQRAALLAPPPKAGKGKHANKHKHGNKAEPAWRKIVGKPASSPRQEGYHTLTMALVVPDAVAAIEFYSTVFGATVKNRLDTPDGKVMHVAMFIGDSALILSDEMPAFGTKSAATLGGSPVMIHHYTKDVDGVFAKATAAKAKALMPVADAFWGDRYGAVVDIAGIPWGFATHKEDVTPEQMLERMKKGPTSKAAKDAPAS